MTKLFALIFINSYLFECLKVQQIIEDLINHVSNKFFQFYHGSLRIYFNFLINQFQDLDQCAMNTSNNVDGSFILKILILLKLKQ